MDRRNAITTRLAPPAPGTPRNASLVGDEVPAQSASQRCATMRSADRTPAQSEPRPYESGSQTCVGKPRCAAMGCIIIDRRGCPLDGKPPGGRSRSRAAMPGHGCIEEWLPGPSRRRGHVSRPRMSMASLRCEQYIDLQFAEQYNAEPIMLRSRRPMNAAHHTVVLPTSIVRMTDKSTFRVVSISCNVIVQPLPIVLI